MTVACSNRLAVEGSRLAIGTLLWYLRSVGVFSESPALLQRDGRTVSSTEMLPACKEAASIMLTQ